MKRKTVLLVIIACAVLFTFSGCNNEELEKAQEELLKTQEELTKAKQTISDYQDVYGKVVRSDVDKKIDDSKAEKSILVASANNPQPLIEKEGVRVQLSEFEYTPGNENVVITFDVSNNFGQPVAVELVDAYVENCSLPQLFGEPNYIDSGQGMSSCVYFSAKPLDTNNLTDFEKLGCKLTINAKDGTNLYSRDVVIKGDLFAK